MKSLLILLLVSIGAPGLPDYSYQALFIIERSTNSNVIHYDAKIGKDGVLDPKEPVVAYWVMLAEDGRRQRLSALEKGRAYGFTIRRDSSGQSYWMTLVSQKLRAIRIYQEDGKVRAVTFVGGHEAYLRKIYVKTRKSGLLRTADYFVITHAQCRLQKYPTRILLAKRKVSLHNEMRTLWRVRGDSNARYTFLIGIVSVESIMAIGSRPSRSIVLHGGAV